MARPIHTLGEQERIPKARSEKEVFEELEALCSSPGFAHVIAYFCLRDQVVGYKDEPTAEEYAKHFSMDRLIRTEISTLVGLMLRAPRDLTLPDLDRFQALVYRAEGLLKELHQVLQEPAMSRLRAALTEGTDAEIADPFESAEVMREPIFYGAESAYAFQYRDFSVQKYARDATWLEQHKGFSSTDAKEVLLGTGAALEENLRSSLKELKNVPLERRTILSGYTFTEDQIVQKSGLSLETVKAVLAAFTNPENGNLTFTSLNEFNSANAYPIVKGDGDTYLLFLPVSLAEALYETPFYWMQECEAYKATAMKNRGVFTEEFTAERLESVFGKKRVFRNVDIWETPARKKKLGEIDTLVLIADHAIVVQAKSKRLTLLARKGNDLQLQADFKGAVQDACDQAIACSQYLVDGKAILTDASGKRIAIARPIRSVYPLCVVSDHYPALSFQARQFLEYETTATSHAPLVCDIFLIDVLAEFLATPLRLLSYLELRARAADSVLLSHELVALGFHLKRNLWLGEYDLIALEDDITTDLDIAMFARREGIGGKTTPSGILTYLEGTPLGNILTEIEKRSESGAIGVGLELLKLSGESANDLNLGIKKIAAAAKDGRQHDITIALTQESGITVHCNSYPDAVAQPELKRHCERRKYSTKAPQWFGLSIVPETMEVRFGLMIDYPWEQDDQMDEVTARMAKPQSIADMRTFLKSSATAKRKPGRNQPCHCGSGAKYKKCCLRKDEA
jgi:uncharacterized protein YchJ